MEGEWRGDKDELGCPRLANELPPAPPRPHLTLPGHRPSPHQLKKVDIYLKGQVELALIERMKRTVGIGGKRILA